jgi:hypothetical protein
MPRKSVSPIDQKISSAKRRRKELEKFKYQLKVEKLDQKMKRLSSIE